MKLFEVEKNYEKETGIITTIENIKKTLNLVNPEFTLFKLSNDFYRFRADILRHTTYGRIYWTEDVDTSLSQYNISYPDDFFRTENDELWITRSNLDDILTGKSLPAKILSPISEEQGYNFAQKLLSLYESSAAKMVLLCLKAYLTQ